MTIGVSSDLANLALALRTLSPHTNPEGQAFLLLAQERLLVYADQVRHMEKSFTPPVPTCCNRLFPRKPNPHIDGYTLV